MGYDICAFNGDVSPEARGATIPAAFRAAQEEARALGGGVNINLSGGCLSCNLARHFFEEAIGRRGDLEADPLTGEAFRKIAEAARWPDPADVPPGELSAYWSARKFFEVCVAHGLGIWSF